MKSYLEDAFEGTEIETIIFTGHYTNWKVHQIAENKELYVYAEKDANVMCISPYNLPDNVYFKNIDEIRSILESKDLNALYDICRKKMDQKSDLEMLPVAYTW